MAVHGDFSEIPVLDLSLADDAEGRAQLLEDLRVALTQVGFLYVSNHGVPQTIVAQLVELLPRLFALSDAAKQKMALENSPHFLGYSGTGSETTGGGTDWREQVEFGTELEATWSEGQPLYERLRGPNQWPSELPELQPTVQAYMREMTDLGERFLRLVAAALDLPDDTFLPYLSDQHRLKLVHYPAAADPASLGQGVGPHKDSSGWWTFLLQASPPEVRGLQALNRRGEWIDVPNIPGTFVVNIGQAFEVVTHGVCKATTHRVLSTARERFSVPFFQGVRRSLTKAEALGGLAHRFRDAAPSSEPEEGRAIDSAFLQGKYDTWGETQLRTKVRSHRENGRKFYPEVFDRYIRD